MHNLDNETLVAYLRSTINKLYKIIPLKEEYSQTLETYIESLKLELIGCLSNFECLKLDGNFISIINILEYLIINDFNKAVCKREVFKCIKSIELIIAKVGETNE